MSFTWAEFPDRADQGAGKMPRPASMSASPTPRTGGGRHSLLTESRSSWLEKPTALLAVQT